MKEFRIMSRQDAHRYSFENINKKTVIISITDMFSENNTFNAQPNIIGICRVKFDDVEKNEKNCITVEDAKKIIDFVVSHDSAEMVIVHCEAGISRSAGVCAALMWIFNGSDMEVFDNPRYCPNMTVYRTILNTYMNAQNTFAASEEDIKYKESHNIKIWKKYNDLD